MYTLYYFNGINYQDITAFCISPKLVHAANIGDMSLDFEFIGPSNISSEWLKLDSIARIFVVKHGGIIFSGRLSNVVLQQNSTKVQCRGLFSLFSDLGSFGVFLSITDKAAFKKQTNNHRDFVTTFAISPIAVEESLLSIRPVEGVGIPNVASNGFYLPLPSAPIQISGNMYSFSDISFNLPSGFVVYIRQSDAVGNIHAGAGLTTTAVGSARRLFITLGPTSGIVNHTFNLRNSSGGTYTSTQDTGFWYSNLNSTRLVLESSVRSTTATINVVAGSTATVTPASMVNIYNGQQLFVVSGAYTTPNTVYTGETITVSGVTTSTFQANFATNINGSSTILIPYLSPKDIFSRYANFVGINAATISDVSIDISDVIIESTTFTALCDYVSRRGDGVRKYYYGVDSFGNFYYKPNNDVTYYIDVESFELSTTLDNIYNKIIPISKYEDGTPKELSPVSDQVSIERLNKARTTTYPTDTTYSPQATRYATAYLEDSVKGSVNTVISITRAYNTLGAAVSLDTLNPGDIVIPRNIPINLTSTVQPYYTIDTKQVSLDSGKIVFSFDKPLTKVEALVNFI